MPRAGRRLPSAAGLAQQVVAMTLDGDFGCGSHVGGQLSIGATAEPTPGLSDRLRSWRGCCLPLDFDHQRQARTCRSRPSPGTRSPARPSAGRPCERPRPNRSVGDRGGCESCRAAALRGSCRPRRSLESRSGPPGECSPAATSPPPASSDSRRHLALPGRSVRPLTNLHDHPGRLERFLFLHSTASSIVVPSSTETCRPVGSKESLPLLA